MKTILEKKPHCYFFSGLSPESCARVFRSGHIKLGTCWQASSVACWR